jgi:hypothetical protein
MGGLVSVCRKDDRAYDEASSNEASRYDETMRRESVYYDARQSLTESMTYAPTTAPNCYPRGSFNMEEPESLLHRTKHRRGSLVASVVIRKHLEEPRVKSCVRGYPGALVENELKACLEFRRLIKEQDEPAYREMIDQLKPVEEEPYALCRFLRARKFIVEDAMSMMEGNIDKWKAARAHDFYPSIESAVGCSASVFLGQFPYFFYGNAKNGCPVRYLMAGRVKVVGLECVTELDSIKVYMWHSIMHQFKQQVAAGQAHNPDIVRCETVEIIDMKGLEASQVNKKTLGALKGTSELSTCFPELLNRLVILNAPIFFSLAWTAIKSFLDPRTIAKIEIYTNEKKGMQRLKELIANKELLSNYGGEGPSFDTLAQENRSESGATRQTFQLMSLSGRGQSNGKAQSLIELSPNEKATISIYSRSLGAKVSLLKNGEEVEQVNIQGPGLGLEEGSSAPICTKLTSAEKGPGKFQILAISNSNALNSNLISDCFIVFVEVFLLK